MRSQSTEGLSVCKLKTFFVNIDTDPLPPLDSPSVLVNTPRRQENQAEIDLTSCRSSTPCASYKICLKEQNSYLL